MKDISLHILDITQNSISAGASMIRIEICEDTERDSLTIWIRDDGRGMNQDDVKMATDPYFTTRTTRNVGLGLPLLMHQAEQAGGRLDISSQPGKGTEVMACFMLSHIDRPPLGDIAGVIKILIGANPDLDFIYRHARGKQEYVLDSREIRMVLEGIPLNHHELLESIREMILENLRDIPVI
jgi:anti-sigma regulatory factor (Ser/Thr protein kinase)